MQLKPIFLHIRPSFLTKPNDWDQISICKNSPCVCVCVNKCESWLRNLLVEWQCNLCRDKRVLIGLEKLECTKKVAHAIYYVFFGKLHWKLESVSFGYELPFSNFPSNWRENGIFGPALMSSATIHART